MRIIKTRRGGRLMHGQHVVSEVLSTPGPTHSVFDVLAAAVSSFSNGSKLAMLGFAAGGMVAPLRALGWTHPIFAVDVSLDAMRLFDACRGDWTGEVFVDGDDAARWLRMRRRRWDVIVEDLSLQVPGEVTKPAISLEELPRLIASRLDSNGVAVVNALPVEGMSRKALLAALSGTYAQVRVVEMESFENRILIAGASLPTARETGARLRAELHRLGSALAGELRIRGGVPAPVSAQGIDLPVPPRNFDFPVQ